MEPLGAGIFAMSDLKLKSASVILLEENGHIRRLVKSTLQGIGFGMVHECATADKVRSIVATTDPDLLILDLDADDEAACALITDIRHAHLGNNPFVIIIGLTHSPDEPIIQRVLDAGTDDLVRKPISIKLLTERITYLIENRKDFVATSDYVGPQRRKGVRPENEAAAQVTVPNSLREKADVENKSAPVDAAEIKRAGEAAAMQKLSGLTLLIISQSSRIEQAIMAGAQGDALIGDIAQISGRVADTRSLAIPETHQNLRQLIASMNGVMAGITETSSPTCRQVEVLRLHAQAIAATIRGDDDATAKVVMAFGEIGELDDGDLRRAAAD